MWLCSRLFVENVRLKIVHAPLPLNLLRYWQSVGAQLLYVNMHILIIGSQWILSMYKQLHPKASKPLNFWSTTRHISWVINGIGPSRSSAINKKHFCPGEMALSEPSETPRWQITLRPVSTPHVGSHITLWSPFCHFFPLSRSPISKEHSGVVANCDHTSEWVHWVHACIGIAIQ